MSVVEASAGIGPAEEHVDHAPLRDTLDVAARPAGGLPFFTSAGPVFSPPVPADLRPIFPPAAVGGIVVVQDSNPVDPWDQTLDVSSPWFRMLPDARKLEVEADAVKVTAQEQAPLSKSAIKKAKRRQKDADIAFVAGLSASERPPTAEETERAKQAERDRLLVNLASVCMHECALNNKLCARAGRHAACSRGASTPAPGTSAKRVQRAGVSASPAGPRRSLVEVYRH